MQRVNRALFGVQSGMKKTRKATGLFSTSLAKIGALAGGAAIVGSFVRLVKSVETFNRAMNQSIAIMANVSGAMRETLERTAIDVAATTVFSADQMAKAYFFLASAGLNATQSIAALPQVAQFAQAGMFDLARATDLLTDAQSALGLTVKDTQTNLANMARVADVLVKANTLANASVEQFSEALTTKAAAALRFVGKEIEEGIAILAVFADQGKKGADAGTALDIVLRELSRKAIINKAAFEEHNIAVFDAAGGMRNIADIVQDLTGVLSELGTELKDTTLIQLGFTAKSISNIKALLGTSEALREYMAAAEAAGGITKEVSDKQLTPMQNAVAKLAETWGFFSVGVTSVTDKLAEFVVRAGEAFKVATNLATIVTDNLLAEGGFPGTGTTAPPAARLSAISDEVVFVSPEEERTMVRIAAQFEAITKARTEAAAVAEKAALADKEAATARDRIAAALKAEEETLAKSLEVKEQSRLANLAAETISALRTPIELFKDAIAELRSIEHLITPEFFERGIQAAEAAFDRMASVGETTFNSLKEKAKAVFLETRTPLERFKKELADLALLGLTPDTLARKTAQLRDALARTLKPVGAAIVGTFGAASAQQLGLATVGTPTAGGPLLARTNRVQDEQLDELEGVNRRLDQLIRGGGLSP